PPPDPVRRAPRATAPAEPAGLDSGLARGLLGAPAEVRLEPPQVVEMLARPEEDESGAQLRLVTGGGGFAHAGEQTSPAFRIADVRPRDCRAVDERVAERHVPRAQRLNLAVEVLAASLEPRVAIGHP